MIHGSPSRFGDAYADPRKPMPNHHPSAAVLLEFLTGIQPMAANLPVMIHVQDCADCRAVITEFEQDNGDLALPVLSDAAVRVAARGSSPRRQPRDRSAFFGVSWSGALSLLDFQIDRRRWIAPGAWVARVHAPNRHGWRAIVLAIGARGRIPDRGNRGPEYIHILHGAFRDRYRTFQAGDFLQLEVGDERVLQVTSEGPCICLIGGQRPHAWQSVLRSFRL